MNIKLYYKQNNNFRLGYLCLILSILLIDFSSKLWIILNFQFGEFIPITSFLNILYIHNSGIAFSLLANDQGKWQRWVFSVIGIFIIIFLLILMFNSNNQSSLNKIAYSILIGGSAGNVLDRIMYGYVIDFIDIYIKDWHWPTFNLADAFIFLGIILVMLDKNFFKK